jgi:hypothetical protein
MKPIIIFLLLVFSLNSQPLKPSEKTVSGFYTVFNGKELILADDSYSITENSEAVVNVRLQGRKILRHSEDKNYFTIITYSFSGDKNDYPVTIDVYDADLKLSRYQLEAPYDLPHPSFLLKNNGEVIVFDPLTYSLDILSKEGTKKYSLEKDVDFQMERSFFSVLHSGKFYLLISEKPLSPHEEEDNVYLYTADEDFQNIRKETIDLDVPVYLGITGEKIFISGVEFEGQNVFLRSFSINGQGIAQYPFTVEQLKKTEDGYIGKYAGTLYKFNDNFEIAGKTEFEGYIKDFVVSGPEIFVLSNSNGWKIFTIDRNMKIISQNALEAVIAGASPNLGFAGQELLLFGDDSTYFLNEFVRRNK